MQRGLLSGTVLFALLAPVCSATAEEVYLQAVRRYFMTHVEPWAEDPRVISAVKAQNARFAVLNDREVMMLDRNWRAEVEAASHPTVDAVLGNPLSEFLEAKQEASDGTITEVFVVDRHGLNVGQSSVTSDYWQGDEDKFVKSFGAGPRGLFVDKAEMDASTQLLQSQVSMTITDEAGSAIGAIIVGINLDKI